MWMLEDPIQKLTIVTSGTSCILLITFFPDKNRKLHSYKKPTHTALETLLNKVFTLNPKNNEKNNKPKHKTTTTKHGMTYIDCLLPINNLGLSKIVDFGHAQLLW